MCQKRLILKYVRDPSNFTTHKTDYSIAKLLKINFLTNDIQRAIGFFNITNHYKNANKNTIRYCHIHVKIAIIKKQMIANAGKRYRKENLMYIHHILGQDSRPSKE